MTDTLIHATLAAIVTVTVAVLVALGVLSGKEAAPIFSAVVGFAAGRSGTRTGGLP